MSSELPTGTSGPPLASSWATPPEFYLDECNTSKSVRRRLQDLGYVVHTPASLQGSRQRALGVQDEVWLPQVGKQGWGVITTDMRIFEIPAEYEAYKQAKVPVFLLPAQSRIAERVSLIEVNLGVMCAEASQLKAGVWQLTAGGMVPLEVKLKRSRRSRGSS
jgi:hypothetical protein